MEPQRIPGNEVLHYERIQLIILHWKAWSQSPDTDGPWVPQPGDLSWLMEFYLPLLHHRIAELRDFQTLYEQREVADDRPNRA